jgi:metal-responsive CopG/Arc/MetJ family transcriptional regulator
MRKLKFHLHLVVDEKLMMEIDLWHWRHKKPMSRSAIIRQLITAGLEATDKQKAAA